MSDEKVLLETLTGFARTLAHGYDISDVLHDLVVRVAQVLEVTGAGVSLLEDDRLRFATAADERIAGLEQVQEQLQEGPCVDAVVAHGAVAADDLSLPPHHWPAYEAQAGTVGIRSVAGVPMSPDGRTIGVLDVYDDAPHHWSAEDLERARVLADIAAGYLVNSSRLAEERKLNEQLQTALDSRIVIEQAKGIIAADRGVGVDVAFRRLRRHANDHHATLRATADAVVRLGLRP